MKKGVRSASAYLYGLLFLVSALVFGFVGYLSFEFKHPSVGQAQVQAAVDGPFVGSDTNNYYVVKSTVAAEDTGNEVCAAVGMTCVGYTLFDGSVCTQVHPTATVDNAQGSGSKASFYCDGAPQAGVCAGLTNTCGTCPSCKIGVSCSEPIGGLYREMYVQCETTSDFAPQDTPVQTAYSVNDVAWTSLVHNNILYVAGDFQIVGPGQGFLSILDSTTGTAENAANLTDANADVNRVISDGSGGWFVAGSFTEIGGDSHLRIGHIFSDGSLDTTWNVTASGTVSTMVIDGSLLYLGGSFTTINGVTRNRLAAVNVSDGALAAWNPSVTGGAVNTIAIDGGTVYAGGTFTTSNTIGGAVRSRIAAVDKTTGIATAWNPNAGNTVNTIDFDGSNVYVGGSFTTIGGQTRNRIAALDKGTGLATTWNPGSSNAITELDVIGTDVWTRFSGTLTVGGASRLGIAKLSTGSNTADAWNATISGGNPNDFYVDGGFIYLGGAFTNAGGAARPFVAKLSTTTALAEAFTGPALNSSSFTGSVSAIASQGTDVFIGGNFNVVGGVERQSLAAFDQNLNLLAWNPFDDYTVFDWGSIGLFSSIVADGNTLYLGGAFYWENPLNPLDWRDGAIAIDIPTGNILSWNPAPNDFVWGMDNEGSTIYFGGDFTTIGGQTRNSVAAIDGTSGLATAWNPNITLAGGARVWDIHVDSINNLVFAGGDFDTVAGSLTAGGTPVLNLVSIDKSTGVAVKGHNANNDIFGFTARGNNTVATGFFSTVEGQSRNGFAEFVGTALTAQDFDVDGSADKGVYDAGRLFISGSFNVVDGNDHSGGVLIQENNTVDDWDPALAVAFLESYTVNRIGNYVMLGGDFLGTYDYFSPGLVFYSGGNADNPDPPATTVNAPTRIAPDNNAVRPGIVNLVALFSSAALTGQTEYRVATGSAANCLSGTSIVNNQTSATTATASEETYVTIPAASLSNGTYYWCARNRISGSDSAWTTMGTLVKNNAVPYMNYVAYIGGTSDDWVGDIEVLGSDIYFTAQTNSAGFPFTAGAYDTVLNDGVSTSYDMAVGIINMDGAGVPDMQYLTFVGGTSFDEVFNIDNSLVLDGGKVYILGRTGSTDFPVTGGAYDTVHNSSTDIVAIRFNGTVTAIEYATFMGTTAIDSPNDLEVVSGIMYIGSAISSSLFPTTAGAYDTSHNSGNDISLVRLNPAGGGATDLQYSTFIGDAGSNSDVNIEIVGGKFYFAGRATLSTFPTTGGSYDTSYNGGTELVVGILNPAGAGAADLEYSTFIGGTSNDDLYALDYDAIGGKLYVAGNTSSSNFPTTAGAYQTTTVGDDVVILRFDPTVLGAGALEYSTYLGGSTGIDIPNYILFDSGDVYVVGMTGSSNFPVTSSTAYGNSNVVGTDDGFFARMSLDAAGSADLVYSTVFGNDSDNNRARDVFVDGNLVYIAGETFGSIERIAETGGTSFDATKESQNFSSDGFLMRIDMDGYAAGPNSAPTAPTTLYSNNSDASAGATNPTGITSSTPVFSAICNDPDGGDILNKYRIQVDNNNDFSSILWDSGALGTAMANCTAGARSANITYGGAALTQDGSVYYWRIKFWDDEPTEGVFSEDPTSTNTFTMATAGGGGGGGSSIQRLQQLQTLAAPVIGPVTVLGPDSARFEWTYGDTANITGFRLINDQNQVAVQVESATAVAATETGLAHNTVVFGRKVTAYNTNGESAPSATYADEYTHMIVPQPALVSRIGNEILVEVEQDINNLQLGLSGIQFELIPANAVAGAQTITSDWVQTPTYTFNATEEGAAYLLRTRGRNQIAFETVWSSTILIPGEESVPGVAQLAVGLSVTASDGQSLANALNPNSILYGEITVNNTGTADADNVFLTLPIPRYVSYIPGTLSVGGRNQTDSPDGDFAQNGNGTLSVIWPEIPFGMGQVVRFQLGFDTQTLIEEARPTDQARAAVNPEVVLQAQASHQDDANPVFSNEITVEPDLAFYEALFEPEPVIEPTPEEPEPIIPEEPAVVPTPEQVEIIETILQEEFPQPGQPAPTQPIPQGETTSNFSGGSFSLSTTSGDTRLTLSGSARTDDDQIQFTGTTSEPFTVITLIFNNSITAIVVSDSFGNWQTFVSADQLGISEGEEAQVTIEAIAAKGDLRSERVQIADVTIARAMRGQIVADFETIVSNQGVIRTIQNVAETVTETLEENEPEIQTTLVVSAPVIVASSVPLWGYIPYIPSLIYHFIAWLFGFLGRKKKDEDHPTWGVVYDAITKLPLPLAIVRIYNQADNKLASTIVTDKLGRYDALLAPGQYRIEVAKPQYQFPSSIVTSTADGAYDRVYRANVATTIVEGSSVLPHVPVDPINVKRQWELSFGFRKAWLAFQRVGNHLATPIMVVGLVVALGLIYVNPDRLANWLMAGLYAVTLASQLKLRPKLIKAWGVVYDLASNGILPLVTIQLIEPATSKVVTSRLSDYEGRFTFLPDPGTYVVKASKPGFTQVTDAQAVANMQAKDRAPLSDQITISSPTQRVSGDVAMKQLG